MKDFGQCRHGRNMRDMGNGAHGGNLKNIRKLTERRRIKSVVNLRDIGSIETLKDGGPRWCLGRTRPIVPGWGALTGHGLPTVVYTGTKSRNT